MLGQAEAKNLDCKLSTVLPCGLQGPTSLGHHHWSPRRIISLKQELGVKVELKFWYSDIECKRPYWLIFLLKIFIDVESHRDRDWGKERELFYLLLHSPISTTARARPGKSQEPGSPLGLPYR